jgi:hypothetical protein
MGKYTLISLYNQKNITQFKNVIYQSTPQQLRLRLSYTKKSNNILHLLISAKEKELLFHILEQTVSRLTIRELLLSKNDRSQTPFHILLNKWKDIEVLKYIIEYTDILYFSHQYNRPIILILGIEHEYKVIEWYNSGIVRHDFLIDYCEYFATKGLLNMNEMCMKTSCPYLLKHCREYYVDINYNLLFNKFIENDYRNICNTNEEYGKLLVSYGAHYNHKHVEFALHHRLIELLLLFDLKLIKHIDQDALFHFYLCTSDFIHFMTIFMRFSKYMDISYYDVTTGYSYLHIFCKDKRLRAIEWLLDNCKQINTGRVNEKKKGTLYINHCSYNHIHTPFYYINDGIPDNLLIEYFLLKEPHTIMKIIKKMIRCGANVEDYPMEVYIDYELRYKRRIYCLRNYSILPNDVLNKIISYI